MLVTIILLSIALAISLYFNCYMYETILKMEKLIRDIFKDMTK